MLGAFILAGPDSGNVEISVDRGEWKRIQLFHERFSKGLNYPRFVILADDLARGSHQAAIRVSDSKPEMSEGRAATMLFFGVNR
jgi:hypothetical protein